MAIILEHNGRKFRFKRRAPMILECDSLGILSGGGNPEELMEDLAEDICVAWDEYAMCDDEKLSPGAQKLKRSLLKTIEEVK